MTNKQLAQALRSAASALEHGRYQTVKRKLRLVNSAWFAGNLDGAEQRITKLENIVTVPLHRRYFAIALYNRGMHSRYIDVIGGNEKDTAGMDMALCTAKRLLRSKSVHVNLIPVSDSKPNVTVIL
jgi:hypothetical protein